MKWLKGLFFMGVMALLFFSCKRNPLKVNISDIEKEVEVVRFGEQLFNLEGKDTLQMLTELSNAYPDFFNLYTYRVIQVGGIGDEDFKDFISLFLNDSLIVEVKQKTDSVYPNINKLERDLKKAFKYYSYQAAWHQPGTSVSLFQPYCPADWWHGLRVQTR